MNTHSWMPRLVVVTLISLLLSACNTGFGRSSNVRLETLTVSGVTLDPSFDSNETRYTSTVPNCIDMVTITAATESSSSRMELNGESLPNNVSVDRSLSDTEVNNFNIKVTAENDRTRTYQIAITRSTDTSTNALLESLELKNLDIAFDPNTFNYPIATNFFVNTTAVTTVRDEQPTPLSTVTLNSSSVALADNTESGAIALSTTTNNDINLHVLAGDCVTENNYDIVIDRDSKDNLNIINYIKATNTGAGDLFGSAIAFDTDTLIVGALSEGSTGQSVPSDNTSINAGAVYSYVNDGASWTSQFIKANDVNQGENFGASVAISGNLLVVGAPLYDSERGRVLYYSRDASDQDWSYEGELLASDAEIEDNFGASVATNGEYIIVGAPNRSLGNGKVYIFALDGSTWEEQTEDAIEKSNSGRFGEELAFNKTSELPEFIVGAPNENTDAGESYVYQLDNGVWEEQQLASLLDVAPGFSDSFGASIAINEDRLVVGAPGDDSSAVNTDASVQTDNDELDSGAAYIYERDTDGDWEFVQFLKASQTSGMAFGSSVALSSNMVAVGAPNEDGDDTGVDVNDGSLGENDSGAVYVFSGSGDSWTREVYAKSLNTDAGDAFGSNIVFSGEYLFVAAPNEDTNATGVNDSVPVINESSIDSGAVYLIK